nr:NADH-quinone oxidoreductase subunit H [Ktedonobacteraceae bacterium]
LMKLGWTLLLPLAVLNIVITAVCVALGWPWWVSGLLGLLVIVGLLFFVRRRGLLAGTRYEEETTKGGVAVLPSSVRLAKFERPVAATPVEEDHQEQDTTPVTA